MVRPFVVAAVITAALPWVVSCAADDATFVPLDPCERRVADAADAIEPDDQVALMDEAIFLCDDLTGIVTAVAEHPGLLGVDTVTFLGRRCARTEQAAVATSPVCTDPLVRAATTGPADDGEGPVGYLGLALDDTEVLIVPDADTPFIDGRPQAISAIVDLAVIEGCAALLAERNRWSARVGDDEAGQEASVYARHADDLAAYLGCG